MELKNKAMIEKKKRTRELFLAVFFGCIGCAALVLSLMNLFSQRFIYALLYIIAFVLSAVYTVMKINTVIPPFVGADDEYIYLHTWENGFFPFRTDKGFFGEFIPEKVTMLKNELNAIKSIYIGTASFISRNLPESSFAERAKKYREKYSSVRKTEFIHITTVEDKEFYMPVSDFDPECLAKIVRNAQLASKNMLFSTGNRKIRRHVPENNTRFGI